MRVPTRRPDDRRAGPGTSPARRHSNRQEVLSRSCPNQLPSAPIMRLLLVEDDPMIGESVRSGLRHEGFVVDWVEDGSAAELALGTGVYDLMLLDLGLPKKEGMEVLRTLRQKKSVLPVMLITARDAVADRV